MRSIKSHQPLHGTVRQVHHPVISQGLFDGALVQLENHVPDGAVVLQLLGDYPARHRRHRVFLVVEKLLQSRPGFGRTAAADVHDRLQGLAGIPVRELFQRPLDVSSQGVQLVLTDSRLHQPRHDAHDLAVAAPPDGLFDAGPRLDLDVGRLGNHGLGA